MLIWNYLSGYACKISFRQLTLPRRKPRSTSSAAYHGTIPHWRYDHRRQHGSPLPVPALRRHLLIWPSRLNGRCGVRCLDFRPTWDSASTLQHHNLIDDEVAKTVIYTPKNAICSDAFWSSCQNRQNLSKVPDEERVKVLVRKSRYNEGSLFECWASDKLVIFRKNPRTVAGIRPPPFKQLN